MNVAVFALIVAILRPGNVHAVHGERSEMFEMLKEQLCLHTFF